MARASRPVTSNKIVTWDAFAHAAHASQLGSCNYNVHVHVHVCTPCTLYMYCTRCTCICACTHVHVLLCYYVHVHVHSSERQHASEERITRPEGDRLSKANTYT